MNHLIYFYFSKAIWEETSKNSMYEQSLRHAVFFCETESEIVKHYLNASAWTRDTLTVKPIRTNKRQRIHHGFKSLKVISDNKLLNEVFQFNTHCCVCALLFWEHSDWSVLSTWSTVSCLNKCVCEHRVCSVCSRCEGWAYGHWEEKNASL